MSRKTSKIFCCVRRPRRPSSSSSSSSSLELNLPQMLEKENLVPPCYSLVTVTSRQPVPLQGILVDVQVKGFVADVSVTLKYKNENTAVGAVFVFPVNEDSAIYSFEATVGEKKIIADLQEKRQVLKTYDGSNSQGQEAFLQMQEESLTNIFICSIGELPPGQEADVTLRYVQELSVEEDGAVRFVLLDVLSPSIPKGHTGSITDTCPQISHTLSLNAYFKSAYGITKIESNCDITPLEYTDNDRTGAKVSLVEGYKFDREVKLLAYYTNMDKLSVMVEAGLGSTDNAQDLKVPPTADPPENFVMSHSSRNQDPPVSSSPVPSKRSRKSSTHHDDYSPERSLMAESVAMLNFYSNFPEIMEESSTKEFIFLVDRSASMACTITTRPNPLRRIQVAKETLVYLLKSLPLGSYFNVFGFGSSFESFFLESVAYTQQSMEEALKKVDEMHADLGGTEILKPLKKIYDTAGKEGCPQLLFLFTDGEVEKNVEKEVIVEVKKNAQKHRCFTFGIGCGASTSLVKGMAEAGNGTFEFISDKQRMQPTVLQTLKLSLQPMARNVSLSWTLPPGIEPTVLSSLPTGFLHGQWSIVYIQLNGAQVEDEAEGEVCLQYELQDEIVKNNIRFPLNVQKTERPTIHRLAAKALISELEHGSESDSVEVKKKILETSLQAGVISTLTAYVAINKDTKTHVEGPPMYRGDLTPDEYGHNPHIHCGHSHHMTGRNDSDFSHDHYFDGSEADSDFSHDHYLDSPEAEDVTFSEYAHNPHIHCGHSLHPVSHSHHMTGRNDYDFSHGHYLDGPEAVWLISLQNADGSWNLTTKFSALLEISKKDIKAGNPDQNVKVSVWVTVLAVIWLHTSCLDQNAEWELLVGKAISWVKAKAGSSLGELVRAGNRLLRSSVDPKVFGL
ncbi:von Willebrand factor A domain-containing protein 5A-like isoform X3 [Aquarana catesbeiana]|uniref:von Willebrand factor A domain-containing protein 5A-like isoform X3 n=1 Tax=Aquarana catesbeiana TaxID=8400 RepID=UPI003CCA5CDA